MEIAICPYRPQNHHELVALYRANGWSNYADHPDLLLKAYRNSLSSFTAWDADKLVGAVRAVGDGCSILYIQDLLVLPEYQRKGIGSMLLRAMDGAYPHVRQKVLLTDDLERTRKFYDKCGYSVCTRMNCIAYVKMG
ncbi:MAG: GNAT family N-acetyltransferase [Oscillospiraceae bacterium]|jgi:ribosomal protein S18 acetylase RimI-like enzyme|nr:GNAT family N-acetyltransferase [Oscillospiraceae bacterium]